MVVREQLKNGPTPYMLTSLADLTQVHYIKHIRTYTAIYGC